MSISQTGAQSPLILHSANLCELAKMGIDQSSKEVQLSSELLTAIDKAYSAQKGADQVVHHQVKDLLKLMASVETYRESLDAFYKNVLLNSEVLIEIGQVFQKLKNRECDSFFKEHVPFDKPPGEPEDKEEEDEDFKDFKSLFDFVDEANVEQIISHTKEEFEKFKILRSHLQTTIESFLEELERKGSHTQTALTDLDYSFDSMNAKFLKQQELLTSMQEKAMKLEERRNFYTQQAMQQKKIMTAESVLSQPHEGPVQEENEEQSSHSEGELKEELNGLFDELSSNSEEIISLHDEIETCRVAFQKQKAVKGAKIYELIGFMPGVNAKLTEVMRDYESFVVAGDDVVQLFHEIHKLSSWYSQFMLSYGALEVELKRRDQNDTQVELRRRQIEEEVSKMYKKECEARRDFSQRNQRYLPKVLRRFLYCKPPVRLRVLPSAPHVVPPITHELPPLNPSSQQQQSIFLSSASHMPQDIEQKVSGTSTQTNSQK